MQRRKTRLSMPHTLAAFLVFGCVDSGNGDGDGNGDTAAWYEDSDGDGYGNPQSTTDAVSQPVGYVSDNTDCDDANENINPGAAETCCDQLDNDCDGDIDNADSDCASGAAVEGEFLIASGTASEDAGFDGTNYLVVYLDASSSNIRAQFVSRTGSLVDSPVSIGSARTVSYDHDQCLTVAFDGANYLVVWGDVDEYDRDGVRGRFVSTAGDLVGDEIAIAAYGDGIKETGLSFGGNSYLLDYKSENDGHIHVKPFSPDGSMGSDVQISSGEGRLPVIAFDGANFLVAWEEDESIAAAIYGRFVNPSGTPVGPEFVIEPDILDFGGDFGIAFNGTSYLVTFHEDTGSDGYDVFAVPVDTSGEVGDRIVINSEPGNHLFPYPTFGGDRFLVIWHCFPDWPSFIPVQSQGQFLDTHGSAVGPSFSIGPPSESVIAAPIGYDSDLDRYFVLAIALESAGLRGLFVVP